MKRLLSKLGIMGLLVALIAIPGLSWRAPAYAQDKLITGYSSSGLTWLIAVHAALVKGFYAEEGLSVQGMPRLDTRTAVEQGKTHRLWVKTDTDITEADFGWFDMDQIHHMVAGKVDYYIVDGMHLGCQSLMVPLDSPMKSAADLKGKKIEVPPYYLEPFLLHHHMWVHHWLKAPGFDAAKEVTVEPMPWEALPNLNRYVAEGFKTGKFDAVALPEPQPLILQERKLAKPLVTQKQATSNREYCWLFIIKRSLVDTQPDKAARIVRAFRRAKQWVAQNPKTAVIATQAVGYYPTTAPVDPSADAVINLGFDSQLDLEQVLEQAIKDRMDSGAIKTDKTPKELVRLHYRRIE